MGKPALGLDARLVDAEGREVGPGEVGEVVLRGPVVFPGYWNRPEATREAFTDGWFHTGDLARRDEEGFWYFAGREKEMIKSGGENVYPAEVEGVLRDHAAVSDACVVGREDPIWEEVPFGVVETRSGAEVESEELRAFCEERLARFKVPRGFAFVDELPRTPIGKPDRALLRERFGSRHISSFTGCETRRSGFGASPCLRRPGRPRRRSRPRRPPAPRGPGPGRRARGRRAPIATRYSSISS